LFEITASVEETRLWDGEVDQDGEKAKVEKAKKKDLAF
jgi:hypothetical protein